MAPPTWVWNGTSTASATIAVVPYPATGVLADDVPLLICVSKATTGAGEPPAIADPAGFTKLFEAWGGGGTAGAGTGPVKLTVWRKTADADGSENGTSVSVVNPANSSLVYCNIHGVRRATPGSTIQTAFASGDDQVADATWSVLCGSDPGIQVDDLLFWLAGATINTGGTFTVEGITSTGVTFGTMTEREDAGTNTGNAARRVVATMACTAGTSSAAPTLTATAAASQTGVGAVLRVREVVAAAADDVPQPPLSADAVLGILLRQGWRPFVSTEEAPLCLHNDFQGTDGAAVTVANSGAGGDLLDGVTGTVVYDGSIKLTGISSLHASVAGSSTASARYNASFTGTWGARSSYFGRDYFHIPSVPATVPGRFFQDGLTPQWGLGIDTAGNLIVRDLVAGATRLTASAPALSTWHRVEWWPRFNPSTGQIVIRVRLFLGANLHGLVPDFEADSTAFSLSAASGNQFQVGVFFSAADTWDVRHSSFALCTQDWVGPLPVTTQVSAETGYTPAPLVGTSQQVKVAPQSGRDVIVLLGPGRAARVQPQAGLAEVALVGTGQAVRRAPETGAASLAVVANGRAVKVAVEGGYEPLVVTASAIRTITRAQTGQLAVVLIGSGAEVHKLTTASGLAELAVATSGRAVKLQAEAGRVVAALVGSGRAAKLQVEAGLLELALVGTGRGVKLAPQVGRLAVALVGTSTEVKRQAETGLLEVALVGQRTLVIVPRAQTGYLGLVLVGSGRAARLQSVVASSTTVIVGQGREVHIGRLASMLAVALVGAGTEVHKAVQTGRAVFSVLGTGAEVKRVALGGRTFFTVVGLGVELVPQAGTMLRIRIFGLEGPNAFGREGPPAAGHESVTGTGGSEGVMLIHGLESPGASGEEDGT